MQAILTAGDEGGVIGAQGEVEVIAIERLMGMILVAIAIQMLMNGIVEFAEVLRAAE